MHENAFECYDEQTDRRQFSKTVEALESHAKMTFKYSEDLAPLFATESRIPVLPTPHKPSKDTDGKETNEADIELWKEVINELAKRKRALRPQQPLGHSGDHLGSMQQSHEGSHQVTCCGLRG